MRGPRLGINAAPGVCIARDSTDELKGGSEVSRLKYSKLVDIHIEVVPLEWLCGDPKQLHGRCQVFAHIHSEIYTTPLLNLVWGDERAKLAEKYECSFNLSPNFTCDHITLDGSDEPFLGRGTIPALLCT